MLVSINDNSAGHDPEMTVLVNVEAIDYIERGKEATTVTLRSGRQFEVSHAQADELIKRMERHTR